MKYHRPKLLKKMLPSNVNTSFVSDVKLRLSVTEINKVELSETKNNVNISSNVETSFPSDVKHRSSDTEINKVEPPKTKNIVNIIEQDGEKVNNRRHRLSYIGVNNLLGVSGQVIQEDFTDEEIGSFLNESMPGEESDEEKEIELSIYNTLDPFESVYKPEEMRCLALIAHNHMKPALKEFVETYHVLLRKFRLTGTDSTMRMVKSIIGDDPDVKYGPTCTSGPLGGDAQLSALMCIEDLGGAIFFIDPLSAHPHQADIDSLTRLANVHNILLMPNPASACAMCYLLREALEKGHKHMISSFFTTLQSPAVEQYKREQDILVKSLQKEDK